MRPIAIRSYPAGPRLWIGGQRVHHGATGCLLALTGARTRDWKLGLLGLLLMAHDRSDVKVWFAREGDPLTVRAIHETMY